MEPSPKRPSFQFYPGDWLSDLKLRRCTPAARGVWMDILCALHDSDDGYGVVRWTLKELARTVGASMAHVRELVEKGVLRGSDSRVDDPLVYTPRSGRRLGAPVELIPAQPGPLWYSKRMVIDEHVRNSRANESGRFGDGKSAPPNTAPKPSPKTPLGDGSSSSSPSSASLKEKEKLADNRSADARADTTGFEPTQAGAICRAMREVGIADGNPGHPTLLALLEAGATEAEFVGAARTAVDRGKGFAYAIAAVQGQRADAAKLAQGLHRGPLPQATERARTIAGLTGSDRRHAAGAPPMEVIDVDAKRLG